MEKNGSLFANQFRMRCYISTEARTTRLTNGSRALLRDLMALSTKRGDTNFPNVIYLM